MPTILSLVVIHSVQGMDDFITKPVKEEVLKAVLEKWISDFAPKAILPAVRLAKPSQTPPPQPPPPPPTSATGGGIAGGSGSSSVETTGVNSMMHAPAEVCSLSPSFLPSTRLLTTPL